MYYNERLEPDYEIEHCCRTCEEHEMKQDQIADYVKEIITQLYSDKPLDEYKLENALDELCWSVGVKPIEENLQIQRPKSFTTSLLQLFPHLKDKLA